MPLPFESAPCDSHCGQEGDKASGQPQVPPGTSLPLPWQPEPVLSSPPAASRPHVQLASPLQSNAQEDGTLSAGLRPQAHQALPALLLAHQHSAPCPRARGAPSFWCQHLPQERSTPTPLGGGSARVPSTMEAPDSSVSYNLKQHS